MMRRIGMIVLLGLATCTLPACRLFQRTDEEPTIQRKRWWKDLLDPQGAFFDDRSHEIERSLEREPNVSLR